MGLGRVELPTSRLSGLGNGYPRTSAAGITTVLPDESWPALVQDSCCWHHAWHHFPSATIMMGWPPDVQLRQVAVDCVDLIRQESNLQPRVPKTRRRQPRSRRNKTSEDRYGYH